MPGICGFAPAAIGGGRLLDEMLARLRHAEWHRAERAIDEADAGLGVVSLEPTGAGRTARSADGSLRAVIDGEIYNAPELTNSARVAGAERTSGVAGAERSSGVAGAERSGAPAGAGRSLGAGPAAVLLEGYAAEGRAFLRDVRGKFAAAIWDGRRRRLILVNDRFGMKPLYYTHARANCPGRSQRPGQWPAGRLLFASAIKALLADPDVPREQNRTGLVQFFSFGQLWNDDTLFESVRVLPPAACLEFDLDTGRFSLDRYWRPALPAGAARPDARGPDAAELFDRVDAALQRAVDEQTRDADGLGLSLSGGMDSRTLLAAIDTGRVRPTCVSMGMRGSQDHVRAAEMARLAGCRHEQYELGGGFLARFREHLERMVELTDGQYLSQCIVMPTLPFYREVGVRVLLRGHAGELMHVQKAYNFSHDAEAFALSAEAALEQWLSRRLRAYMLDGLDEPLFEFADAADVEAIARASLRESLAATAGWQPAVQRISHLFLTQRLRRETAMSLVKFGSVVETRVPYLDPELIDLLFAAPPEFKTDDRMQTHILKKRRPEFLRVKNVNTGARVDAGRLARRWGTFKQRVLARLGVPGYQPYERLGLWLRRELRRLVTGILLDERCLDRGVFRPDAVRRVVAQHLENRRNHTYLILALMIFEQGQRQIVDGSAIEPAELAAAHS